MLKHIQKITQHVIRVVQRVLIAVFLVILYVIGFGLTSLFFRIFKRDFLSKKCEITNACWRDALGYEVNEEDNLRQS
jgi:hypothetical protein